MSDDNTIDTTASVRETKPLHQPKPSAGVDLGTLERFDPRLLPNTRAELADVVKRCLKTEDPRAEGIPPAFHAAVAQGIHEALLEYRELAEANEAEDYVNAINTIAPLFEATLQGLG